MDSVRRIRTSGQIGFNLHVLLGSHAKQSSNAVSVGVSVRKTSRRDGRGRIRKGRHREQWNCGLGRRSVRIERQKAILGSAEKSWLSFVGWTRRPERHQRYTI